MLELVALEALRPKQLLTVHYTPANIVDEYLVQLPSMLDHYYARQRNASVMVFAPHNEIAEVVERLTSIIPPSSASRLSYNVTDEGGRGGQPMFGPLLRWTHGRTGVEFLFQGARVEPPSTLDASAVAFCVGRMWTQQYVLHAGVQAAYHMLRLPPLFLFDFVIKMDTDMTFLADMEDLGARLAAAAHVQVMHTLLLPASKAADNCQRGVGSHLELFQRREQRAGGRQQSRRAPPWWCREPIGYIFYTNFVGFRTRFLLAPATQALSAYYYNEAWRVFFQSRAQEQGIYTALVCHSLHNNDEMYMADLGKPPASNESWLLDLSSLRGTTFRHGQKRRSFANERRPRHRHAKQMVAAAVAISAAGVVAAAVLTRRSRE